jgi:hypothetical protein
VTQRAKHQDGASVANFDERVMERIQTLPAVEAASAIQTCR